jgi:hypothetical protein
MSQDNQIEVQKLQQEIVELKEKLTTFEAERDQMLIGLERLGWPCRLVELPGYVETLTRILESTQNELIALKRTRD